MSLPAKQAKGFSLLEFVLVIILLMAVVAIAIPQFEQVKNDAHISVVDAVAGGFASAVMMVKGQWELEGRPNGNTETLNTTVVNYGGVLVGVDGEIGTPTADGTNLSDTRASAMSALKCQQVLNAILQDAPSSTISDNAEMLEKSLFLIRYNEQQYQCIYYLGRFLQPSILPKNGKVAPDTVGFSYFAKTGKVQIF